MWNYIKHLIKDIFLITKIRTRFNPSVQITQRQLFLHYKDCAIKGQLIPLRDTGFRVFSQMEEDGMLLYIFSVIGMGRKIFVEIGSDDGVNSNSANLYFNFGWHGLFVDSNPLSIQRGKRFFSKYPHPLFYQPQFVCTKVTKENINEIISANGFSGEIELLSIDIDGIDYWIWDAINVVDPKVVIIETKNEFGTNDIVVPYDPNYVFPGKHPIYQGASPIAMTKLAKRKGYRLVGANDLAYNFIYIKKGYADNLIPEVSVESLLHHPSVKEGYLLFEEIKNWDYLKG